MKEKELFEIFGVKDFDELEVYLAKEAEKLEKTLYTNPAVAKANLLAAFSLVDETSEEEKKEIKKEHTDLILQLAIAEGMGFVLGRILESKNSEENDEIKEGVASA